MDFQTPKIYTQPWEFWEFTWFDKLYEQENMWKLVAKGWPINWNYVTKDNICPVCAWLVQRILNIDLSDFWKQSTDMLAIIGVKVRKVFIPNSNQCQEGSKITSNKA